MARPESRRRLHRDQPAGEMVAGRRKRGLVAAVRRPLGAGRVRQSPVSADDHAPATSRRRRNASSRSTSTRQGDLGEARQPVPERRAAAPRRLGVARRRSRRPATSTCSRSRPSCSCFAPDGKILWERSLPEEYGAITTHGGRTTSPIVDGDKVILNALLDGLGRSRRGPAIATSRSTRRPARRSGSARRRRGTTTPTTRRRSSPTSTARG